MGLTLRRLQLAVQVRHCRHCALLAMVSSVAGSGRPECVSRPILVRAARRAAAPAHPCLPGASVISTKYTSGRIHLLGVVNLRAPACSGAANPPKQNSLGSQL